MAAKMAKTRAAANLARAASLAETRTASSNGLADAHTALGPCAAPSMELVLTSTTYADGLASGKELVSTEFGGITQVGGCLLATCVEEFCVDSDHGTCRNTRN